MSFPAVHNRDVWFLVMVYFLTMIVFGFLHSVLSVIFVVEGVISAKGEMVPIYSITLSQDAPSDYDPCSLAFGTPGCAYDLAMTSLTSMLVTVTPFTVAGVTFEPPNGTLGLPYHAMKHFSDQVASSPFDEEHRRYCLPTLEPHLIRCTEEPFNQVLGQTDSNLMRVEQLLVYKNHSGTPHQIPGHLVYQMDSPYPTANFGNTKYRTNDEGQGIFLAKSQWTPAGVALNVTLIAGMNNGGDKGYGSLLYRMTYGSDKEPDLSSVPQNSEYTFAAKCEIPSIVTESSGHSSWRQVDFTLKSGLLKANVTEERCPNPRGPYRSGYGDLYIALEGAASVLASSDGYSKLFNENVEDGTTKGGSGSMIFDGMSRLDATVNKMYHLVQTSYTESVYSHAINMPNVSTYPIMMTDYPHLYVIRISWTPTTYIGLALSILITLNAYLLLGRWIRATYRFGFDEETWNLLRPVELMSYSLTAWQDLIHHLHTVEQRRMTMRGETHTILREYPGWQPMNKPHSPETPHSPQSPASTAVATSPVSAFDPKFGSTVNQGEGFPGLVVQTTEASPAERDVERAV